MGSGNHNNPQKNENTSQESKFDLAAAQKVIDDLAVKVDNLTLTVETQKNEIAKQNASDMNPRVIRRGNQRHPHFVKNNIVTPAVIKKED